MYETIKQDRTATDFTADSDVLRAQILRNSKEIDQHLHMLKELSESIGVRKLSK